MRKWVTWPNDFVQNDTVGGGEEVAVAATAATHWAELACCALWLAGSAVERQPRTNAHGAMGGVAVAVGGEWRGGGLAVGVGGDGCVSDHRFMLLMKVAAAPSAAPASTKLAEVNVNRGGGVLLQQWRWAQAEWDAW